MFKRMVATISDKSATLSTKWRSLLSVKGLVLVVTAVLLAVVPAVTFLSARAETVPGNDMIGHLGWVSDGSLDYGKVMRAYDSNSRNFRDAMDAVGITRAELEAAGAGGLKSWDASYAYSFGWVRNQHTVGSIDVKGKELFARPTSAENSGAIYGFIGHSARIGWFGIMQACGNLATPEIPTPKQPGISITKKVDGVKKKEVGINQDFKYEIDVKNTGEVDLTNAKVTDTAPAGVTFTQASAGTISNNSWSYTIPSLKVGESKRFTITAVVKTYKAGEIVNTACVEVDQVTGKKCDTATIIVKENCPIPGKEHLPKDSPECKETPTNPNISITKKVDGQESKEVKTNEEFTYQLVVKNTGDVDLKAAKVTDDAPAGVQFISADKGTVANNKWSYTVDIAKGAEIAVNIKAKVTVSSTSGIINTACVEVDQVTGKKCDTATVIVKEYCPIPGKEHLPKDSPECKEAPKNPGVSIEKVVNGKEREAVKVNQEFVYGLTVKNTGDVDLKNVVVTDNAPTGVQFISADKGEVKDNKWSYTIPALAKGQSVAIAIKAKVTVEQKGDITNTACVNAPEVNPGEPTKDDDCDTAVVVVTENCPIPGKETLPKDSPDCKEMCPIPGKEHLPANSTDCEEKCPIPGKEHLPKNSPDCKETPTPPTPTTPTELPKTGIAEGISAIVGLGSLIAAVGYYVTSRRSL